MTNLQIIANAAELHQITEPVNTYQGWKRIGFQVKKGSKALFRTKIWKPCKVKDADAEGEGEGAEEKKSEHMILVDACFFGLSQVERAASA